MIFICIFLIEPNKISLELKCLIGEYFEKNIYIVENIHLVLSLLTK